MEWESAYSYGWTVLAMFVGVWSERHCIRGDRMGHDLVDVNGSDESCGSVQTKWFDLGLRMTVWSIKWIWWGDPPAELHAWMVIG